MLLEGAADDIEDADAVRRLLRGLREVRMAKLRKGVEILDASGGVEMNGVGGMEVSEGRAFVGGVIDGLRLVPLILSWLLQSEGYKNAAGTWLTVHRKINASREQARRDRDREERENGFGPGDDYDDDNMDMR
jgi:GINS complex subunit 2